MEELDSGIESVRDLEWRLEKKIRGEGLKVKDTEGEPLKVKDTEGEGLRR